ncbi:MAG: TrmH family RNA methyltransferase [Alteromonas naphthalenivorans]|jgi:TrmH family RNA methyltransferase
MKNILSVQNEQIKNIVKLHTSKGRKEQEQFLAEGQRALESFANAKWQPANLFATKKMAEIAYGIFDEEPIVVSEQVMKKMSTATTPSGILAVFSHPQTTAQLTSGLVLSEISDPGNMGALIRSAIAFGSKSIVIVDGCDPYSPKVIQSSAGVIAQANIIRWSWKKLIENKGDFKLCALVVSGGKAPDKINKNDLLLVVGNEAHGLLETQISDCDSQLTLPISKNTESLNAAIAGSIALYLLK